MALTVSCPFSRKMTKQSWHTFKVQVRQASSWPPLAGEEEEEEPQKESVTICSKATWDCSSVTKLKAMTESLSFLSCSETTSSP